MAAAWGFDGGGVLRTLAMANVVALGAARADVVWYVNDYPGFVAAVGDGLHVIDFETLPDGSPSYAGAVITPDFNYTHLGATFYPHYDPGLYIFGNEVTGFELVAESYPLPERNWIIADLVAPGSAVGTFYGFHAILSAYDPAGQLLGTVAHTWPGMHFIGIVSDVPIAYATVDRESTFALSGAFLFADVPEPSTVILLLIAGVGIVERKRVPLAR